ncbi:MAG: hypothetical protein WCJ63_08650, partial [Actinomycetes bacterium]
MTRLTPETPSIDSGPSGLTSSKSATFAVSGESGTNLRCSLDGGTWLDCSSPVKFTDLAEGDHSASFKSVSSSDYESEVLTSETWHVDSTPPSSPTITAQPAAKTRSAAASLTFTGSEAGGSFVCSVDGGTYSACASPKEFESLTEGEHSVAVKQLDETGNESDEASATWIVDLTLPAAPSITSKPSATSNSSSASIVFTGEANATFACSVDGGDYSTCSSPQTLTGLSEGPHSLAVKQIDEAGNTGPNATVDWTIDVTAPTAPDLSGAPSELVNIRTANVGFSGEDGATFTCSVDDAPSAPCGGPPVALTGLADGDHSISVTQTDPAGNTSPPTKASWRIDATAPPTPEFTAAPTGPSSGPSVQFEFKGETDSPFECSVDGGAFEACQSPLEISGLTTGLHSLMVRQVDAAGNTSTAATTVWEVGKARARVAVGYLFSCAIRFDGSASCWGQDEFGQVSDIPQGVTWRSIDAGAWHACGVTTDGDGLCWGKNEDGNTNVPSGRKWIVIDAGYRYSCGVTTSGEGLCWGDNEAGKREVPPGKTWKSLVAGNVHTCGVTTSGEGLCWGNDGGLRTSIPSGHTWATIRAGLSHSCGVTTTGQGFCWGDNSSEKLVIPDGKTWASIEAGAGHNCGVTTSGEGFCWGDGLFGKTDVPIGRNWKSITAGDTSTCGVTTSDRVLCWGSSSDGQLMVPSLLAPELLAPSLAGTPPAITNSRTASFTFNGESGATFICSVDGSSYSACVSPKSLSGLSSGAHSFAVKQTDVGGDASAAATASWNVDLNAPEAPVLSGRPAALTNSTSASISFSGESGASFTCSVDGGAYS